MMLRKKCLLIVQNHQLVSVFGVFSFLCGLQLEKMSEICPCGYCYQIPMFFDIFCYSVSETDAVRLDLTAGRKECH